MITLSGLQQIASCPGSASLPRQARTSLPALLGHAIHMLVETMIRNPGVMVPDVPIARAHGLSADDAGRLAFLASHLALPIPAGALAEVPLGYWPDGSVRRVTGGAGAYEDEGQILSGTLDGIWAEPGPLTPGYSRERATDPWDPVCPPGSTLWVYDLKTGDDEHVPPIDRNWQLRAGALLAARWTGARRVIPAICYVNAGECAAWLRENPTAPYAGRWEVGAPLDAAALDAVEVELRAVLARARGEEDGAPVGRVSVGPSESHDVDEAGDGVGRSSHRASDVHDGRASDPDLGPLGSGQRAPLILGPHCEHCGARGACPALAAEAVGLARAEGLYLPPGAALTRDAASRLAGLLSPARRVLDAVEEALKAHARAHGPILLADGREWGPALEPVTRYKTAPTFEALAAVVGDERANEAFTTSTTALRDAVAEQGRGAWKRLQAEIETRGGVVPGAREVWRKMWPAKSAEVTDALEGESDADAVGIRIVERPAVQGDSADRRDLREDGARGHRVPEGDRRAEGKEAETVGGASVSEPREGMEPERGEMLPTLLTRAPCSVCGDVYTVSKAGVRAHNRNGGLRCTGSRKPPA